MFDYIQETGYQLSIQSSTKNRSCTFICVSHHNCPFKVRVNKVRLQDKWTVKGENLNHNNVVRETKDGRKIKHRKFYKDKSYNRVNECKADLPNASDVQKASANVFGEDLLYH